MNLYRVELLTKLLIVILLLHKKTGQFIITSSFAYGIFHHIQVLFIVQGQPLVIDSIVAAFTIHKKDQNQIKNRNIFNVILVNVLLSIIDLNLYNKILGEYFYYILFFWLANLFFHIKSILNFEKIN